MREGKHGLVLGEDDCPAMPGPGRAVLTGGYEFEARFRRRSFSLQLPFENSSRKNFPSVSSALLAVNLPKRLDLVLS